MNVEQLWRKARTILEVQGHQVRKARGTMPQADLAAIVGTTGPRICQIERGHVVPTAEEAHRLTEWMLQTRLTGGNPAGGVRVPRTPSPARTDDPDTSHQAAASVNPFRARALHVELLRYLQHQESDDHDPDDPHGHWSRTHEGIAHHWETSRRPSVSESGLRTRVSELVPPDFVQDSGHRAEMTTGRRAIVWEITDAGRAYLQEHDSHDGS